MNKRVWALATLPNASRVSLVALTLLSVAIALFLMDPGSILLMLVVSLGAALCIFVASKSFLGIFVIVFGIGYFQGLIEQFVQLPVDVGILKYGLLLLGGLMWMARVLLLGRLRLSRGLVPWMLLWIPFYVLFGWALLRALQIDDLDRAIIIQSIGLWAVLNIPLVILVNSELKSLAPVYKFLEWLVWLGILAAVVGIVQYVIGPERLQAVGFHVFDSPGGFALLGSRESGSFRVFSVFASHYEFASFLVISILAQLVLQLRRHDALRWRPWVIYSVLAGGLLLTFNVTLWLTLAGTLVLLFVGWSGSWFRMVRKQRFWQVLLALALLGVLVFAMMPTLRDRILGVFAFESRGAAQAGESLYWRTVVFSTSLGLIREFPLGLGLAVNRAIQQLIVERGYFLVTSDVFFTWLMLSGGIVLFFCYLLLLVVPLLSTFNRRRLVPRSDRPLFWAIWSTLLVGVVLGSISNAALVNGSPTNLLVWAGVGVLYRLPIREKLA